MIIGQKRFFNCILASLVLLGFLQSCTGSFTAAQELKIQGDAPGKLNQIDLLCQQAVEQSATGDTIMSNQIGKLWGEDPRIFHGLALSEINN